eukprot:TRINITY_DN13496_c0_g1_i1.p1 TRINITY_DN13496_c0_g1~~TRINITY_DN13496_c0_g1_i1.p1  ORF type:complete len:189 (-),score=10.27 TRINITY_DN13496_c0_g1_i1:341-907(-)
MTALPHRTVTRRVQGESRFSRIVHSFEMDHLEDPKECGFLTHYFCSGHGDGSPSDTVLDGFYVLWSSAPALPAAPPGRETHQSETRMVPGPGLVQAAATWWPTRFAAHNGSDSTAPDRPPACCLAVTSSDTYTCSKYNFFWRLLLACKALGMRSGKPSGTPSQNTLSKCRRDACPLVRNCTFGDDLCF